MASDGSPASSSATTVFPGSYGEYPAMVVGSPGASAGVSTISDVNEGVTPPTVVGLVAFGPGVVITCGLGVLLDSPAPPHDANNTLSAAADSAAATQRRIGVAEEQNPNMPKAYRGLNDFLFDEHGPYSGGVRRARTMPK